MSGKKGAIDALFTALPSALSEKTATGPGVFVRAAWHADVPTYDVTCHQTFKPLYNTLSHHGLHPVTTLPEAPPAFCLYAATRQREENRHILARLWERLQVGGVLVCAQHNDFGAKSLEKEMRDLTGGITVISKHHSRVMWAVKTPGAEVTTAREWNLTATAQPVGNGHGLRAAPGMFSWREVDAGSAFLTQHLPKGLSGHGADLGAGWGYLSHHVLSRFNDVRHMDLYEAEKTALDMAAENLSAFAAKTAFYWTDLQAEPPQGLYDFILCNPPMHHMATHDIGLAQDILTAGVRALAPGGGMYLVANRHLPYEATLTQAGADCRTLAANNQFKVLEARK